MAVLEAVALVQSVAETAQPMQLPTLVAAVAELLPDVTAMEEAVDPALWLCVTRRQLLQRIAQFQKLLALLERAQR